jgi:hypothetical protein
MDRECIFRVAEDVRTCFYEFTKAVEEITAESRDPMIGVFTMPSYHGGYLNQIPAQQTNFVEPIRKEITSINTDSKLEWKGDKTDLAELVWALSKSNRIIDTTTAQPVTQKELTRRIETLLGVTSLDVAGLMKGRMNTYKATNNGNTFVKTLFNLVSERAANS